MKDGLVPWEACSPHEAGGTVCRERSRESAWISRHRGQDGAGCLNERLCVHPAQSRSGVVGRDSDENHDTDPGTGWRLLRGVGKSVMGAMEASNGPVPSQRPGFED